MSPLSRRAFLGLVAGALAAPTALVRADEPPAQPPTPPPEPPPVAEPTPQPVPSDATSPVQRDATWLSGGPWHCAPAPAAWPETVLTAAAPWWQ